MSSKLVLIKKFVGTLRNQEDLLMSYFKADKLSSSGIVEGLNLRINLCLRKAYGYRSFELLEISLYQTLRDLSEPRFTHKFCGRADLILAELLMQTARILSIIQSALPSNHIYSLPPEESH